MRSFSAIAAAVFLGVVAGGLLSPRDVAASNKLYDMNAMMAQPHPFSTVYPVPQPGTVQAPLPGSQYRLPASRPAPVRPPAVRRPAAYAPAPQTARAGLASADEDKGWIYLERPPRDSEPFYGLIAEARFGIADHANSSIGSGKESGTLFAPELLFVSPGFMRYIGSPKPTLGFQYNTGGDRNFYYGGLTWQIGFFDLFHVGLMFGGAYQDGDRGTNAPGDMRLGCDFLFREAITIGFTFKERHSIELQADDYSHAGWCSDENGGTESLGIVYAYRF